MSQYNSPLECIVHGLYSLINKEPNECSEKITTSLFVAVIISIITGVTSVLFQILYKKYYRIRILTKWFKFIFKQDYVGNMSFVIFMIVSLFCASIIYLLNGKNTESLIVTLPISLFLMWNYEIELRIYFKFIKIIYYRETENEFIKRAVILREIVYKYVIEFSTEKDHEELITKIIDAHVGLYQQDIRYFNYSYTLYHYLDSAISNNNYDLLNILFRKNILSCLIDNIEVIYSDCFYSFDIKEMTRMIYELAKKEKKKIAIPDNKTLYEYCRSLKKEKYCRNEDKCIKKIDEDRYEIINYNCCYEYIELIKETMINKYESDISSMFYDNNQ